MLGQGDTGRQLIEGFAQAGLPIGRYRVGGMDDSRNPRTGYREFFDPGMGGMEGEAGMGEGYGDGPGGFGDAPDGMDGGPAETGTDFGQVADINAAVDAYNDNIHAGREAARAASAAAMNRSRVSRGVDPMPSTPPPQRGWFDAIKSGRPPGSKAVAQALTSFSPLGSLVSLGDMFTNMAVNRGWDLSYDFPEGAPPGVGGDGRRIPETAPKNGMAPTKARGVYTPGGTGEGAFTPEQPTYLKYMQSPNVA